MTLDGIAPADMLLFAAIVRERNLTAAARQQGISKQAVSRRLARLEASLGVRLLERTTRTLRPTEIGAAYAETCSRIAEQIAEANTRARALQEEPVGTLRITSPVLFGRRYLAPIMAAYLQTHPKIRIEVLLTDHRLDLVEDGIDLAVRVGLPPTEASLTARRLGAGRMVIVASRSFLDNHGRPTVRSLARARCIGMQAHETWHVRGVSVRVEPVLVVNDLEVSCEAAIRGAGIARLPTIVCRDEIRRGELVVLFDALARAPSTHDLFAVWPSRRFLPAKVRRFLDLLVSSTSPISA